MLPNDWELRMERAALEGAITRTRTLRPFLQELSDETNTEIQRAINDGNAELDAICREMAEDVRRNSSDTQQQDH